MIERQPTRRTIWIGRVLSLLVVAILLADGAVNLLAPELLETQMNAVGFPVGLAPLLGAIMLICALLYGYSPTAVLGAVLVTGFLGGAISLHLRTGAVGNPSQIVCVLIGIVAWAGLFLRDSKVRMVLPIRQHETGSSSLR